MAFIDSIMIELVYSFLLISISLAIYLKTSRIYDLSRHRGIFHFRNIFLYFSLAFLFRLIHLFLLIYDIIFLPGPGMSVEGHILSLILVGFFSTMAIVSTMYTVAIRRISISNRRLFLIQIGVALMMSVLSLMFRSPMLIIIATTGLLAASTTLVLINTTGSVSRRSLAFNRITYLLLLTFWILNVLTIGIAPGLFLFKLVIYIISGAIFLSIYLRVKRLFAHAKEKGKARNHK